MKQIRNIFIVLILVGSFSSCTSWLDQAPYDKVRGDELYSTEAGAQEALNGLYLGLLNRNLYGGEMTVGLIEALSMHYSIPDGHKYNSPVAFEYNSNASRNYFLLIWKGLYKLIAECNVFLAQIEQNKEHYDVDNYKLYQGEAIALRTFLHFDLFRLFGTACTDENKMKPAILYYHRETELPTNFMTNNDIVEQLLIDIDKAIDLLAGDPVYKNGKFISQGSTFWDFRNFRFNVYAAYVLKARICLHSGDHAAAYAIASALLNEKNPSSGESNNFMTVFPSVLTLKASYRDPIGFSEMVFGMHDVNRVEVHNKYFSVELAATQIATMSELYYDKLFPVKDIRRNNYGSAEELSETTVLKSIMKYQKRSVTSIDTIPYRYQIIPLIKKSEVYLIAAEASSNDTDKKFWLEKLRLTRGYDKNNVSDDLKTALREEYEREMYAEGQFFYFLKRNAITTLNTQDVKGTDDAAEAQTKTVSLNYYVFPIPDEETNNGVQ